MKGASLLILFTGNWGDSDGEYGVTCARGERRGRRVVDKRSEPVRAFTELVS